MTCIVGIVKDGNVYIGGDSAGVSSDYDRHLRKDKKVFRNGPFVMGFTSSFRMGQLLQYKLNVPRRAEYIDIMDFMVNSFVDAVRFCLKDGGYSTISANTETGGTFLVGYQGRLFQIQGDFQVAETISGYDAVGCGQSYALGSLFTTVESGWSPEDRITVALLAASHHSAGVCEPFLIETLKGNE